MQVENIFTPEEMQALRKVKSILRAVDHPLRLKILSLISANSEMVVGDIYRELRIEQSVASSHLKILRKAGVVNARKDKAFVRYSVNSGTLKEIVEHCEMIDSHVSS